MSFTKPTKPHDMAEDYANQCEMLQRDLSESNEYARRLNLKIADLCKERDALKEWIEDLSFWEWNPSTEKMGTVEVLLDPQEFAYVGNRKPEGLK